MLRDLLGEIEREVLACVGGLLRDDAKRFDRKGERERLAFIMYVQYPCTQTSTSGEIVSLL